MNILVAMTGLVGCPLFAECASLSAKETANKETSVEDLLRTADQRIERCRKGDLEITVLDKRGNPVSHASVRVKQLRHEFLFGANIFLLRPGAQDPIQKEYQKKFQALLNYATLPFYWGSYEREKGKTSEIRLRKMAQWCVDHGIVAKGHPLVWHNVYPAWATDDPDETVKLLEQRVRNIVGSFRGLIDIWDVVNEATVAASVNNGEGRWIKKVGDVEAVKEALGWARAANPKAMLLVNDFNIGPAYERQLKALMKSPNAPDVIGIQSHMHRGEWPLKRVWQVCESYARFGKPIHFTEVTVLSGAYKKDNDWMSRKRGWTTTKKGEKKQADYVTKFYTILFSHPAVEAITWWDFSDLGAWQGAPAGLVRKDMSPKPVYTKLMNLIHNKWWTDRKLEADAKGKVKARVFGGMYEIIVTHESSQAIQKVFVPRRKRTTMTIHLSDEQ